MNEFRNRRYYYLIFGLCLGLNIYFSFTGLNHTLIEYHSFRQTQTAISTSYLEEGYRNTIPVMGAPWRMPFEYPLFQKISHYMGKIFPGLSKEAAGRLASLLFFWLSLIFISSGLKTFIKEKHSRLMVLSLILACPVYLYWSRTYMIESTAFFFSIVFLWAVIKINSSGNKYMFALLAIIAGNYAALVKITTLAIFYVPAFILFVVFIKKNSGRVLNIALGIFIFFLPLLAGVLWSAYASEVRNYNPIAAYIFTQRNLNEWLFGTWEQRVIVYPALMAMFVIAHFVCRKLKYRYHIFVSLLAFAAGPGLFTNLYLIHDYYYYANALFLIAAAAFFILSLEGKREKLVKILLLPGVLIISLALYIAVYFPVQVKNNDEIMGICTEIQKHTTPDDILLIYGHDWNPAISYYSGRKSIMERYYLPLDDRLMVKTLEYNGKENIKAMIIAGYKLYDSTFMRRRFEYFGLDSIPVYSGKKFGNLYINRDYQPF